MGMRGLSPASPGCGRIGLLRAGSTQGLTLSRTPQAGTLGARVTIPPTLADSLVDLSVLAPFAHVPRMFVGALAGVLVPFCEPSAGFWYFTSQGPSGHSRLRALQFDAAIRWIIAR